MGMARYNKMNQTVLLRIPESSKLNQKYHIAIQSIAVPRIPGHTRHRTNKAAVELDSKDPKPADPNAMRLAIITPKRESAVRAQMKYVRTAIRDTIQFRLIGRYSIAVLASMHLRVEHQGIIFFRGFDACTKSLGYTTTYRRSPSPWLSVRRSV